VPNRTIIQKLGKNLILLSRNRNLTSTTSITANVMPYGNAKLLKRLATIGYIQATGVRHQSVLSEHDLLTLSCR